MAALSKPGCNGVLGFFSIQLLCVSLLVKIVQSLMSRRSSKRHRRPRGHTEVKIDATFFRRLVPLLKICVPGIFTVEFAGVFTLTSLLLLRTKLTLLMARTIGRNGRLLVEKKTKDFLFGVADVALLSIPGTVINVAVTYCKSMLQQRFRDNLQTVLQSEYLRGNNVYVIATQNNIDNPDHRIAQDSKVFCSELTDLFQSVLKPFLDVVTLSMALSKAGGYGAPGLLGSYYVLVGTLMATTLPNFAGLVATSQEKEGDLRTTHSQLVQHAEEVAFYGGEELEREHADRLLRSITRHELLIKNVKWWSGLMDSLLIKYGAVCIGYIVCGAVTLDQKDFLTKPELTQVYLQSSQLYMPLSVAIGKLLLLHKKIGALCGSAHRVGELREVLHKISVANLSSVNENFTVKEGSDEIVISHADIATPSGTVLIEDLSLTIIRGRHVLVMGTNGSGKSALIRTLSQLWPLRNGTVTKPEDSSILFLPQKAYLPPGTLRAQMVYPLTEDEAAANGVTDADILNYSSALGLIQVVEREGGLDAIKNWHEVLSGGERQRVALVRVLVHRPMFVFLDECTSAVSQDDEPRLYAQLQNVGVTLISVSHREALRLLHDQLLELDGEGGYRLTDISASVPVSE